MSTPELLSFPQMIPNSGSCWKKEPLLKNPITPQQPDYKLPTPPPIAAFRKQNHDSVPKSLTLLPKTEDSPTGLDMEFIKTVPPPPFPGSSMGERAISTSSLQSNASSNSTSLPFKKPLCKSFSLMSPQSEKRGSVNLLIFASKLCLL